MTNITNQTLEGKSTALRFKQITNDFNTEDKLLQELFETHLPINIYRVLNNIIHSILYGAKETQIPNCIEQMLNVKDSFLAIDSILNGYDLKLSENMSESISGIFLNDTIEMIRIFNQFLISIGRFEVCFIEEYFGILESLNNMYLMYHIEMGNKENIRKRAS